jgi:hypothetical protein
MTEERAHADLAELVPVDRREERCLKEIRQRLRSLGIQER